MKKKEERKKWKGLKMGNLFVGFVALMKQDRFTLLYI